MHSAQDNLKENLSHGTSRMIGLLEKLGDPHLSFSAIHVAGTNGKGSVCAYIASVLHQSGVRVGRFNSPHLVDVWDSIWIDGRPVDKTVFEIARLHVDNCVRDLPGNADPSTFERLVCTAYFLFKQAGVTMGVVEVGLGGRDDATNVFDRPAVSVITAIGLDHTGTLGNTLEEIASVKAGIIRPGRPVVVAPQETASVAAVIQAAADEKRAPCVMVPQGKEMDDGEHQLTLPLTCLCRETIQFKYPVVLHGDYQRANAATAIATLCVLQTLDDLSLPSLAIEQGMRATRWPGRLDVVTRPQLQQQWNLPSILVDGAHNPPAARALRDFVDRRLPTHGRVRWILAATLGKDLDEMFRLLLRPEDFVFAVPFTPPEGMPWIQHTPPDAIAEHARAIVAKTWTCETLDEALAKVAHADGSHQDLVVLCGSLYLVADFYRLVPLEF